MVKTDSTFNLRDVIEQKMNPLPSPYAYPLGYSTWGSEEILAALDCLCEQRTTMWEECAAFENEFAGYLGSTNAVMVNSGSSADLVMMLAARECGMLRRGDEILIPAVTWPTQVWAAIEAGFKVKLVDVEVSTLNISAEILERAITSRTRAIFLVHLMGSPCDIESIMAIAGRYGLYVFEDCCEALGASWDVGGDEEPGIRTKLGSWGIASAFSFFASHHISTMEGGMIASSDSEFAETCRLLRAHGWARDLKYWMNDVETLNRYGAVQDPRYLFLGKGFNFRPTELQGAIGRIQLKKLDHLNAIRNKNFAKVALHFRSTNGQVEPLIPTHHKANPAWFALPFVLREGVPYSRKQVTEHLENNGIATRPIVGGNLARHPAFWKHADMAGPLPGANAIHDRGFYCGLPPIEFPLEPLIGALNSFDPMLRACA